VTEFVLLAIKLFKLEFPLKIYSLVVELDVEMDVMEDIHQELGIISKELVLLLDGFTIQLIIVAHIHSPHVITTQQVNINHVEPVNQLQNVFKNVLKDTVEAIQPTDGLLIAFTQFHLKLLKFKLKL